jgi:hypothetical protein
MAHFYTTITLRGPDREHILSQLRQDGRQAYVSPTIAGCTVVYDADCDDQDTEVIATAAARLSATLECPALAVLNHADELLWYALYDAGRLVDTYDSNPDWFVSAVPAASPAGGDPARLCAAFDCPHVEQVARILRESNTADAFLFAVHRHQDLARALGLPELSVGFGYEDIADDNLPENVEDNLFQHT